MISDEGRDLKKIMKLKDQITRKLLRQSPENFHHCTTVYITVWSDIDSCECDVKSLEISLIRLMQNDLGLGSFILCLQLALQCTCTMQNIIDNDPTSTILPLILTLNSISEVSWLVYLHALDLNCNLLSLVWANRFSGIPPRDYLSSETAVWGTKFWTFPRKIRKWENLSVTYCHWLILLKLKNMIQSGKS